MSCPCLLLDRGVETGKALKQLIAEFLGIPTGEKLTMHRKCLEILWNLPPVNPEDRLVDFAGMMTLRRRAMMLRMRRPDGRGDVNFEDDDGDDD